MPFLQIRDPPKPLPRLVLALDQLLQSFIADPADRLIMATAQSHGLPLATHDRAIQASAV
jgi:PIN domain nuclease of toxin-antitoxin system